MKSKLRHPVRSITEPFGKAGLTVAILALVLATTGAAFAAAGLNSKQKKEVTKIAKKYAGKPGTNGTNGTPGEKGEKGAKGDPGAPGKDGTSVTSRTFEGFEEPAGEPCAKQGGSEFDAAEGTVTYACNGETGFTATLPSGKTEKGDWSMMDFAPGQYAATAASFNIPLAVPLPESKVHFIRENGNESIPTGTGTEEVTPTQCGSPVGTPENPKASPGNLCVYALAEGGLWKASGGGSGGMPEPAICALGSVGLGCLFAPGHRGADAFGFGIFAETKLPPESTEREPVVAYGTWAVTAP